MQRTYEVSSKKSLLPFNGLSVNFILIIINVVFYLTLLIFGFFSNLNCDLTICKYIALKPFNILNYSYFWTFLTSMFMHGSFFHLFANMISLMFLGSFIERIIGRRRYFWFYIISGIIAGAFFVLLSFVFPTDIDTFAVGASGAIFGIAGLMVILTPNLPLYVMFIPIPIKAKYAIPGLLIVLWMISVTGNVPIGNTAHLGGLIAGLAYGFYLKRRFPNKTKIINKRFS